jgi:hypothetical protein
MSCPLLGKTDVPREPGHFRFGPTADSLGRQSVAKNGHRIPLKEGASDDRLIGARRSVE